MSSQSTSCWRVLLGARCGGWLSLTFTPPEKPISWTHSVSAQSRRRDAIIVGERWYASVAGAGPGATWRARESPARRKPVIINVDGLLMKPLVSRQTCQRGVPLFLKFKVRLR